MPGKHEMPDQAMKAALAERGLVCHLIVPSKPDDLHDELRELLEETFNRHCTPAHFVNQTWAITLRPLEPENAPPVACMTLQFHDDIPSYFLTGFEAVHPDRQRAGLGRLLYDCAVLWTRFLIVHDPLVIQGVLNSGGSYHLVSFIDMPTRQDSWVPTLTDNEYGHGTFLKKLGFDRAVHDFGQNIDLEIAFSRAFHVPISDYYQEEVLNEPARPASA